MSVLTASSPAPGLHNANDRTAAPADTRAKARVVWIDQAKGIGILLVVLGHALGGLLDGGLVVDGQWFEKAIGAIYVFHMPLFFMISALFSFARIQSSTEKFMQSMVFDLILPGLLWSVLLSLVRQISPGSLNHPVGSLWMDLLRLPYMPVGPFWFLYSLVILHTVAAVMQKYVSVRMATAALVLFTILGHVPGMPGVLGQTAKMAPWYALGYWIGTERSRIAAMGATLPREGLALMAMAVVGLILAGPQTFPLWSQAAAGGAASIASFAWGPNFYVLALVCVAGIVALSALLPKGLGRVFSYFGQRTMAIYVMHVIIVAGLRVALVKIGLRDPMAILVIITWAGLGLPVVAFEISSRMGISRWVGLGRAVG